MNDERKWIVGTGIAVVLSVFIMMFLFKPNSPNNTVATVTGTPEVSTPGATTTPQVSPTAAASPMTADPTMSTTPLIISTIVPMEK